MKHLLHLFVFGLVAYVFIFCLPFVAVEFIRPAVAVDSCAPETLSPAPAASDGFLIFRHLPAGPTAFN